MKINNITTIVDLAFNLSGSLAGIPVILPQLPVGERVGFDTLPEVWEDVDDIGQTWTPDLDGVEVDIAVEAYNPTAIQKAPYSTDMKCIDVATGWGDDVVPNVLWKDYLVRGRISFTTGLDDNENIGTAGLRSSNYIPVLSSQYTFINNTVADGNVFMYGADHNFLSVIYLPSNTTIAVNMRGAKFFRIYFYGTYASYVPNGDIKLFPNSL